MCICLTIVAILVAWRTSCRLWRGRQLCARERRNIFSHREGVLSSRAKCCRRSRKENRRFQKLRLPRNPITLAAVADKDFCIEWNPRMKIDASKNRTVGCDDAVLLE